MIVSQVGASKTIGFVLEGEPCSQNGWKLSRAGGHLYDPMARKKTALRKQIAKELLDLGEAMPVFKKTKLRLVVSFGLHLATSKDIDNMLKFLQDAMEKAIYDDDKWIFELSLNKRDNGDSTKTIISISNELVS